MKKFTTSFLALAVLLVLGTQQASAQELKVDFNSTSQDGGPHNQEGWQAYDAAHENADSFVSVEYEVDFPGGTQTVTVTPDWPNTTDARVRQSIDRGAGNDANWLGENLDLLTDWIGSDSRTNNGGNGPWNRVDTDPTYLTLTLGGLAEGDYFFISYHHDTENMWSDFQVEVSTDGGATFSAPVDLQSTDSTPGGNPDSGAPVTDGDISALSSTFKTAISSNGTDDIVIRYAPYADGVDPGGVHKDFFLMNGFKVIEYPQNLVPSLSTWGMILFTAFGLMAGAALLGRRNALVTTK